MIESDGPLPDIDDGSWTPTTAVLVRLKQSLDGTTTMESNFSSFSDKEPPIETLQYFPFLNLAAKK